AVGDRDLGSSRRRGRRYAVAPAARDLGLHAITMARAVRISAQYVLEADFLQAARIGDRRARERARKGAVFLAVGRRGARRGIEVRAPAASGEFALIGRDACQLDLAILVGSATRRDAVARPLRRAIIAADRYRIAASALELGTGLAARKGGQ